MFKKIFSEIGGTVAKNVNNNVILRLDVVFFSLRFIFVHFLYLLRVFIGFKMCYKNVNRMQYADILLNVIAQVFPLQLACAIFKGIRLHFIVGVQSILLIILITIS